MAARLILRRGEGTTTIHSLNRTVTTIGRDEECDIIFADERISRRHAQIAWERDGYLLSDLSSRNGTFLNGRRIETAEPLRNGDIVGLPGLTLRFDQAEETIPWQPEGVPTAPVRFDTDKAEVWIDGRPISLTAKEYLAVQLLYGRAGGLVRKEDLATHVWPEYEGAVGDYNIDQLIFRLRGKLEAEPRHPRYLVTVRGLGYKLVLD